MIRFNHPYIFGPELERIKEAVNHGRLAGNGDFTRKCHDFFESTYGFKKCLLTTSCTDALEMAAILLDIQEGDEVIVPSYTFVSSANAFLLRGASLRFADSQDAHPNMSVSEIERLISPKTKVIVVVHYGGISCEMDEIMHLAERHSLFVVEDAAQAINASYKGRPLGSIGHLAAFSFHETKNLISGEGGMLVVNDDRFIERSEIIWEKGTNRASFYRGEIDKYGWVDLGSSFLPSELTAAFLHGQLEFIQEITSRRREIWEFYQEELESLEKKGFIGRPVIPDFSSNNGHLYFFLTKDIEERDQVLDTFRRAEVGAVFHYQSLHNSPYFSNRYEGG